MPAGQCVDVGTPYRTAIFYHDENQMRLAEQSLAALIPSGRSTRPVVTAIAPIADLYPAEAGHHPPPVGMDTWQRSVLKNYFFRARRLIRKRREAVMSHPAMAPREYPRMSDPSQTALPAGAPIRGNRSQVR